MKSPGQRLVDQRVGWGQMVVVVPPHVGQHHLLQKDPQSQTYKYFFPYTCAQENIFHHNYKKDP